MIKKLKSRFLTGQAPPLPRPPARRAMAALLGLLLLGACSSGPADVGAPGGAAGLFPVPAYTGGEDFIWCVPYARQVSGVQIRGDAHTWWDQAAGRYERGTRPAPYAVLALKRDRHLGGGHIGVVTGILGPREIRVSHANWGWTAATRGRVYTHMPAVDVSEGNDWSRVRFEHPAVGAFGRVYAAHGFIYPHGSGPDVRVAAAEAAPSSPAAASSLDARTALRQVF